MRVRYVGPSPSKLLVLNDGREVMVYKKDDSQGGKRTEVEVSDEQGAFMCSGRYFEEVGKEKKVAEPKPFAKPREGKE